MNNSLDPQNFFDNLPVPILLLIFNKVNDAKSLIQCLSVCKRFESIISETDSIFVSVPPQKPTSKSTNSLLKFIAKPIQFLHCIKPQNNETKSRKVSYFSPNEALKNFNDVKCLHIEVPCVGEKIGFDGSDSLIKWKADFGSEFKNCVVLVAKSFEEISKDHSFHGEKEGRIGQLLSEDMLKLQVKWTLSCLMAASARHCSLKQILAEKTKLENVIVSDVNKQGIVRLGKDQIGEMKSKLLREELDLLVGMELSMVLWYVPVLKLPKSGNLMKEVALVLIRPLNGVVNDGDLFGFDGEEGQSMAFDEAVKEMMKMKKSYVMTMNSF